MTSLDQYQNNTFQLDVSDPTRLTFEFTLQLASVSAVILYPSLCTPVVSDGKVPVRLLLLTQDRFHATWEYSEQKGNHQCQRMVQRFLHVRPWNKRGPGAKSQAEDNLLLYHDMATAVEHIKLHYLGQLTTANRMIADSRSVPLARLDEFAIGYYNQHGFRHLFEIELNQFPALSPCKGMPLVDLNWIELDSEATTRSAALYPDAAIPAYFEEQDELLLDFHAQRIRADALHAYQIKQGELHFDPDPQRPLLAHHPVFINNKAQYNFGHLTDVHISSRQHVFNRSRAQVIPGMGAASGSERIGKRVHRAFDALYNLMEQFGRNIFTDGIIFTGDLIDYNRNYNPGSPQAQHITNTAGVWQAMNLDHATDDTQYPHGIDNLIFYTLVHWFYDTYQKPIFLSAGNHEAYSLPYGISPRVVSNDMSALKELLSKRPASTADITDRVKDVLQRSIGIDQPRRAAINKGQQPLDGTRANEGIPADHNLTVYEACLMYGPQYYRVVMAGFKASDTTRNFQPQNLDWFQLIFTPFSDFSYHWARQTLTLLAWGDDEAFMFTRQGLTANSASRDAIKSKSGSFSLGFSSLPRATRAIDNEQRRLLEHAVGQSKPLNLMASHFTLINYHLDLSFQDKGKIGMGSYRDGMGYFDWGTFDVNRDYLYRDLLRNRKIQVTLSGHSHRAGLYQLDDDMSCSAQPVRLNECPGQVKVYQAPSATRTRIVVSACGGPIAVQNYSDELAGKGMERPSGSLVRFDALGEQSTEIKVFEAVSQRNGIDTSKPRFCVAVDFVDLLKGDPAKGASGVFDSVHLLRTITGKRRYGVLVRFADRMPKTTLIAGGELCFYTGAFTESYSLKARKLRPDEFSTGGQHDNQYWLELQDKSGDSLFDKRFAFYMQDRRTNNAKAFLTLQFSGQIKNFQEKGLRVYQQYDFESPWIFPVEIESVARKVAEKGLLGVRYRDAEPTTYKITRHPVWGEIPEFGWYQSMDGGEYGGDEKQQQNDDRL